VPDKLKVAVLGCGGIIGQHMLISVPESVEPLFVRKHPFPLSHALDLEDWDTTKEWLDREQPHVIVNLAGESRPDVVERDMGAYQAINAMLPERLAEWCDVSDSHLIQVSSQAVFDGNSGPYEPHRLASHTHVNCYGVQKAAAEYAIRTASFLNWTIVRPTFVLGIRPFPALGRENPAESILSGTQKWQVDNRWFSVSFAWDVAEMLWKMAQLRPKGRILHCGNPERLSRYELARKLNPDAWFEAITHEDFVAEYGPLVAERPLDTTYKDAFFETPLDEGLELLRDCWKQRATDGMSYRAAELSAFLHLPVRTCVQKLAVGFGPLHNAVTEDFRAFMGDPLDNGRIGSPLDLLDWYRNTEAYLWELTAYHCDAGFNYAGTCEGVITRLKGDRQQKIDSGPVLCVGDIPIAPIIELTPYRVLCLGDGVGTLTIKMKEAGFQAMYHDLMDSRTAAFALARFAMRFKDDTLACLTAGFDPGGPHITPFDAIVSLDYLEHVPNVEDWVRAIFAALKPGGLFCAQNAFAIGSGPEGDMPMHLSVNDHWEQDWDPMLARVGFVQEAPQWYRKPL
jgi:dTDP-4-dehydrorhamnose reductase/SAM-dependent methyltransferase